VKFLAAALVLNVMSRAQLRELMVLFVVSSTLTLAVFFLALLLLPFETFTQSGSSGSLERPLRASPYFL
jgi:hypothetical protein